MGGRFIDARRGRVVGTGVEVGPGDGDCANLTLQHRCGGGSSDLLGVKPPPPTSPAQFKRRIGQCSSGKTIDDGSCFQLLLTNRK